MSANVPWRSARVGVGLLATALIVVACDRKGDASASSTDAAPAPSASVAAADLVVAADLAAEASKAITKDNYKSELETTASDVQKP